MFLALGVAGWSAGVFHFMTHAFFKALLFLAAGVVIEALARRARHLQDGRPAAAACRSPSGRSVIGAASLAALPLVTAGFYSKDLIVGPEPRLADGNTWLWLGAVIGALLTALYTFRLVFLVFFGDAADAGHAAARAGA